MKTRKLFIVTICLFLSSVANAQFDLGVKGGAGLAFTKGAELASVGSYSYEPTISCQAGIAVRYLFTKSIGVESGLYYSKLGNDSRYSYIVDDPRSTGQIIVMDISSKAESYYLQMPIQFLYQFNFTKKVALYPAVGIYLGYGMEGTYSQDSQSALNSFRIYGTKSYLFEKGTERNPGADANRFDMGLSAGLNLKINKVFIGVAYEKGLLNVIDKIDDFMDKTYNSNVKLTLGLLFQLR